jgi:hypothetical protein
MKTSGTVHKAEIGGRRRENMNNLINASFLRITKRAETNERSKLIDTFVDVGPLFTVLDSADHQVIYGRRGTGKTHALLYLAETRISRGDIAIYVDMRTIGSTGGIYADDSIPLAERATRLIMDTLGAVHEGLLDSILDDNNLNLGVLGPLLDDFSREISRVVVVGDVTQEAIRTRSHQNVENSGLNMGVTSSGPSLTISDQEGTTREMRAEERLSQSGVKRHRVHFGATSQVLSRIISNLGTRRIWVLLDEWSIVPNELQPLLADLLRRSLFPVRGITVKIGAIEQRTTLLVTGERGDYTGIELGADMSGDVNLDDFMVFENDALRATEFFQELLYKHYRSAAEDLEQSQIVPDSTELLRLAFTQRNAFDEFVRAAEGVPRDAIHILGLATQRAGNLPISTNHLRTAAKSWYQRDKEAPVSANPQARDFLHWIIEEVIAHRRARAFLFRSNTRHDLIDSLFDARILHVLKRNIAAHDQPGIRYDVYKIDYGCYVDLLTTLRAPQGLLPAGDEITDASEFVEVPPDDYRAIRRAILDPDKFESLRISS